VTGSTNDFSPGCADPSPSTDAMTLIAGVIVPSPKKSATPNIPSKTRAAFPARPLTRRPRTSATRAMMPPSPRLSAPITKVTYLTETTRMIVQITSEIIPSTPAVSGRTPCTAKMELIAYRGLVPISPKTMPSVPRVSAAAAAPGAPLAPFLPLRRAVAAPRGPPPAAGPVAPAARAPASATARLGDPGLFTRQPQPRRRLRWMRTNECLSESITQAASYPRATPPTASHSILPDAEPAEGHLPVRHLRAGPGGLPPITAVRHQVTGERPHQGRPTGTQ